MERAYFPAVIERIWYSIQEHDDAFSICHTAFHAGKGRNNPAKSGRARLMPGVGQRAGRLARDVLGEGSEFHDPHLRTSQ